MRKLLLFFIVGLLVLSCYPPQQFDLDEPFQLELGQTKSNNDTKLRIRFNAVVSDGRCPIGYNCLLPGNASVELTLRHGFQAQTFVLNTYDNPRSITAFGYTTTLIDLAPQRSLADPPVPNDYEITLRIGKPVIGCVHNTDCRTEGSYCRKDNGDCDGSGQCVPVPDICTTDVVPVCGCDGKTYSNACVAARSGVNVAHKGSCEPDYCWNNKECAEDEYCFFEDCTLETGKCQERPDVCPFLYEPVCGCDGQTYANRCLAASQGMSVDYAGQCRDVHCDDGTIPACRMIIPECKAYEILAYQNSCYACVNPATCMPWGEPNCKTDEDCPEDQTCDMCGGASCPVCEDCVPTCRPL